MRRRGWKLLTPRQHAHLHEALDKAYAREHELVLAVQAAVEKLETLTVERDHYREDSLIIGLVVAYLIDNEDGELVVSMEQVNAYLGRAVNAEVSDGFVHVTLGDRLPSSPEGDRG